VTEIRQQLVALRPDEMEPKRKLANILMNSGILQMDRSPERARQQMEAAQEMRRKLLDNRQENLKLVRDLAVQVAGMSPIYVDVDRIPADVLEAKKAELLADESVQKKPEAIRGQIIDGQLKKWYSQVLLYDQPFRDEERTIRELINERIATIGENIRVRRFTRYALGEEL